MTGKKLPPHLQILAAAHEVCMEQGNRVRAEDLLSILSGCIGDGVLVETGHNADRNPHPPGTVIFDDQANYILSGDKAAIAECPPDSVFGMFYNLLPAIGYDVNACPDLGQCYRYHARHLSNDPFFAPVEAKKGYEPYLPPVVYAALLRPFIHSLAMDKNREPAFGPRALSTMAVVAALNQVKDIKPPKESLKLVFQTIVGTAKKAPLPTRVARQAVRMVNNLTLGEPPL